MTTFDRVERIVYFAALGVIAVTFGAAAGLLLRILLAPT